MRKKKSKIYKLLLIFLIIFSIIIISICSYYGIFFFSKGFNNFDYLVFNIIGDALLVGIVTHISSKSISTNISKKEFERNNKINVAINEHRNKIMDYEMFMDLYNNSNAFFAIDNKDKEIIDYVYKLYDFIIKTFQSSGKEKQIIDSILNIPFFFDSFKDEDIVGSYTQIFTEFDKEGEFNNITILKVLLGKEDYIKLGRFSSIVLNFKHYQMTNLNSVEGCQILLTANDRVSCKISCLPNYQYDIYVYYDDEKWLQFIAFSFDYDLKEYATNLMGTKYTKNDDVNPIRINLNDYIDFK